MTTNVVFDLHLLHLPPINLYNIRLYYRYDGEFFRHLPEPETRLRTRSETQRIDPKAVIHRTVKHR